MGMVLQIINVFVPILLCILIGFFLTRLGGEFDSKTIGSLVANVGYPALVLSHLGGQHVAVGSLLSIMLAATVVIASFGIIGLAVLTVLKLPARAFLPPMMLSNVGNIGVPISAFAFGDEGLAYALAFLVVVVTGLFTIGMWIPMGKVTFREVINKPVIYAVVIALALMATDVRLPTALDRTLSILGGLAIPLMLLMLGHSIVGLNVGNLSRGCYLAVLHVVMAAGVALGVVHLFGFEGTARGVFILQCMMPVAVANYLWVELFIPEHAPDVASFVLASTLLAIVVLPSVLIFWV